LIAFLTADFADYFLIMYYYKAIAVPVDGEFAQVVIGHEVMAISLKYR
jgi:hypothetical protein